MPRTGGGGMTMMNASWMTLSRWPQLGDHLVLGEALLGALVKWRHRP